MQLLDSLGEAQVQTNLFHALLSGSNHTASLVCSSTGKFVDQNGTSRGLGGELDKLWLGALRSRVDVVLTSGMTFRAEQYRMPKRADLAVLSKHPLDRSTLSISAEQQLIEFVEADFELSALELVQSGYKRIHIEFGPSGISALLKSSFEFDLWLSGLSENSVTLGAQSLGLEANIIANLDGLSLALAR